MKPSLARTRRIDHPTALLVLCLLVVGVIASFVTLRVLDRDTTSSCEREIGRMRIYMATNSPPSPFDEAGWASVTSLFESVGDTCPDDVAIPFQVDEFTQWSFPGLQPGEDGGEPYVPPGDILAD